MTTKSSAQLIGQDSVKQILEKLYKLTKNDKRMTYVLQGNSGNGISTLLNNTLKDTVFFTAADIKTMEDLTQCIRKCVIVKIKEKNSIIKGEVMEMKHDRIVLKTTDMQSEFTIGKKMKQELIMEKVSAGDVIQIVRETGKITKLGKVFVKTHDYDVLGPDVHFVDCVEGNLVNTVEIENSISLYEFDFLNSNDIYGTRDINLNVRKQIDDKISEWIEEGVATVEYRNMVIKNSELLNDEFLYHLVGRFIAYMPSICLVSGQKEFLCNANVKNCLMMTMKDYTETEIEQIVQQYCMNNNYTLDNEVLAAITAYASETSIRKALKLLDIASSRTQKSGTLKKKDFDDIYELIK